MKKTLCLFILVFCLANAHAQLALRLGVNQATITSDDSSDNLSSVNGFQLGITYTDDVVEKLSVRPGLLYSRKGFGNEFGDVLFNYFEIPLDLVFHAYVNETIGFNLHGGLYYGLLLSAFQEVGGVNESIDLSRGFLKRGDLGIDLGFTVDVKQFFVGFNGGFALSKLNTDEDDSIKNRNFSLIAGYRIGIRKTKS